MIRSIFRRGVAAATFCALMMQGVPVAMAHDFVFIEGGTSPTLPAAPSVDQPPAQNPSSEHEKIREQTDPADLSRGEFIFTRQDLVLPGRGFSVDVTFTYRSQSALNGAFGYGWDMSYYRRVYKLSDNSRVVLRGNGRKDVFTFNSAENKYVAPPGVYDTLVQNSDGTCTLVSKHGDKEFYDVNGTLTTLQDRNGNALVFAYDPGGRMPITGQSNYFVSQTTGVLAREYRLTRITDTVGRTIDFTYTAEGRLATIRYAGRTITYTYDGTGTGDLISVRTPITTQSPSGAVTQYAYAGHKLTAVTDPKGQTYLTNSYNSFGCLTQQTYGSGTATFSYISSNVCPTVDENATPGYHLKLAPLLAAPGSPLIVTWVAPTGSSPSDLISLYRRGTTTPLYSFNTSGQPTGTNVDTLTIPNGAAADLYEARYIEGNSVNLKATSNTVTVAPTPAPMSVDVTDRLGFHTRYTFDGPGHITKMEQGPNYSVVTTYEYDSAGNLTRTVFPRGNELRQIFDAKGNVTEMRRKAPPGSSEADLVTTFTYESQFNFVKTVTDPLGHVTTYTYDYELSEPAHGNLRRITAPAVGGVTPQTIFVYNGFGQVTSGTDPNNNVTTFQYDSATGGVNQIVRASGTSSSATTGFTYDTVSNITAITDPNNQMTHLSYNALNQLTQVLSSAPFNYETDYNYDPNGNLIQTDQQMAALPGPRPAPGTSSPTDDWQTILYTYTVLDQLASVADDLGQVTRFTYDTNGSRRTITDPKGQITTYGYNERDLLINITDAAAPVGVTTYGYDSNGNVLSLTDARSNATSFTYDGFDRVTRTTYPGGTHEDNSYDSAGNLVTRVTPAGQTITYAYDALNRFITKITPEKTTTITYDAGSRPINLSDPGVALVYTYDPLNRVSQVVTTPSGASATTVTYSYDRSGNRTQVTYPVGSRSLTTSYDALNRLSTIRDNSSTTLATYTYDPLSRRTQWQPPVGTAVTYQYDVVNRLTQLVNPSGTKQYTYDLDGNRLTMADAAGTHAYTYDPLSQLTAVDEPSGFPMPDAALTYDKVGNRTRVVSTATTNYTSNTLNQYTAVGTASLTYDTNGNLASDGTRTLTYDSESRLKTATVAGVTTTYIYDPLGRRLSKTTNGVLTRFLYEGEEVIAETDSAGTAIVMYLYGPGMDEPIALERLGNRYMVHADGLGSSVALTNSSDTLVEKYSYDIYGTPRITDGSGNVLTQSAYSNHLLFTGREYDTESGLYHYRARSYSPTLGRFLQRDPLGYEPDVNLYRYTNNNPVNWMDPFGLDKGKGKRHYWQFGLGIGGTVGGNPLLMPAGFISGSISIGITSQGQLFVQTQGSILGGLGLYGGVGGQLGVSRSDSPVPVGVSRSSSFEGQFNAGWGTSGGGLTVNIGRGNGSLSTLPTRIRGGIGFGIMGAGGVSWTTTVATPSIGEMFTKFRVAINGFFGKGERNSEDISLQY